MKSEFYLALILTGLCIFAGWCMPTVHFWWYRRKADREMDAAVRAQEESRKKKAQLN